MHRLDTISAETEYEAGRSLMKPMADPADMMLLGHDMGLD